MAARLLLLAIVRLFLCVPPAAAASDYGTLPLVFAANRGQAPAEAQFVASAPGYDVLLNDRAATLALRGGAQIRLVPLAAPSSLQVLEPLNARVSYLRGRDPRAWALDVPVCARVARAAGPGVRLEYYSRDGKLEFDYVIAPGADPRAARFRVEGATARLTAAGELALRAGDVEVVLRAPHVYQITAAGVEPVAGGYVLRGNEVSFALGQYDRTQPLVIDPQVLYATYLGGRNVDRGTGIAVSGSGYAHITGWTLSSNFPVAHVSDGYHADAFLVKLDPTGTRMVYGIYFGGTGDDRANAVALDSAGNAYITGVTDSTDLPLSGAAVQKELRGGDMFVAKFGPTGVLLYSTYLGGTAAEVGQAIAVSPAGEAYVTGYTNSDDYPTTPGAFQTTCTGCGGTLGSADAFVTRLNANASALVYSTYLSGNLWEHGRGIALDGAGNALVAGFTASDTFPVLNPIQATRKGYQGRNDAFVSKLNPSGSALIYSTYLGSFQDDFAYAIAVDISGNAYVAGESQWSDFPTTPGAYLPNAVTAGFLTKISPLGVLVYSTRLTAGGYAPSATGVAVNSAGEAFVTGKASDRGSWTPYAQQFSANGSALIYSELVGGISLDEAAAIALDSASNAYVTGFTHSADFPATSGVVQPSCGVDQFNTCTADAWVARIGAPAGVPAPPGVPAGLTATGLSRSQVGLAWSASAGVVDGYRIQRCTGTVPQCDYSSGFLTIATVEGTSTGYLDERLPSGMTYTYRVQAFNAGGASAYSNRDDATTLVPLRRRRYSSSSGAAAGDSALGPATRSPRTRR